LAKRNCCRWEIAPSGAIGLKLKRRPKPGMHAFSMTLATGAGLWGSRQPTVHCSFFSYGGNGALALFARFRSACPLPVVA
jgi:hypothetical protein